MPTPPSWTADHHRFLQCPAEAVSLGVDRWCGTATIGGVCCGICPQTTVSGQGQLVYDILVCLFSMLSLMLAPGSASEVVILQSLFTDSFIFGTLTSVLVTPGYMSKWQLEYALPQAMNFLPVVAAITFSPYWTQIAAPKEAIIAILERDKLNIEDRVKGPMEVIRRHRSSQMSPHSARGHVSQERHSEQNDLDRNHSTFHTPMTWLQAMQIYAAPQKRWNLWTMRVATIVWGAHLSVWWGVYEGLVFPEGKLKFWQANCEKMVEKQMGFFSNKNAGRMLLGLGTVIFAMQIAVQVTGRGGCELVAQWFWHRERRGFSRRKEQKHGVGDPRTRKPHGSLERGIQLTICFSLYLFWMGTMLTLYLRAASDFLLIGLQAFTFGQVQQVICIIPSMIGLSNAFRSWSAKKDRLIILNTSPGREDNDHLEKPELSTTPHSLHSHRSSHEVYEGSGNTTRVNTRHASNASGVPSLHRTSVQTLVSRHQDQHLASSGRSSSVDTGSQNRHRHPAGEEDEYPIHAMQGDHGLQWLNHKGDIEKALDAGSYRNLGRNRNQRHFEMEDRREGRSRARRV